jgi:hypothetical protein
MGGKGSASNVMKQDYGSPTATTEGGWEWADKTAQAAPPKKEEVKEPPITEDPSKVGAEAVKQDAETQPYAPPGWGNYPSSSGNLTGLGDALVTGMQAQPGKAGPVAPNYVGQV